MTEIEKFKIELSLNATFEINGRAWTKPGAATGITWKGIPTEEQVQAALKFMNSQILEPTMNDLSEIVIAHTKKAQDMD